uniref:Variant surface glycoprotein 1125.2101 n=1 Tax=Trypanosoma brucei TaxID=5691 RepID=A0A1J0R7V4_9TRYP|nr:variant surface glycoprotein 1125.2101 [Trypanosoma brucei]
MLVAATTAQAAKEAIGTEAWKPVCELEIQLRKTTKKAAALAGAIARAIKSAEAAKLKAAIAAKQAVTEQGRAALEGLAIALANKLQTAVDAATDDIPQFFRAAAVTSDLRGRISETIQLLLQAGQVNSGSAQCLANTAGSGDGGEEVKAAHCHTYDLELSPEATDIDHQHIGANGFTKIATSANAFASSGSTGTKCGMLDIGTTPGTHAFNANAKLFAGALKITAATTGTLQAYNTGLDPNARDAGDIIKAAFYDANKIQKATVSQYSTDEEELVKSAASIDALTPLIAKILKRNGVNNTDSERTEAAKRIATAKFGAEGEHVSAMWTELNNRQVKGYQADPNKAWPLSGIDTIAKLQEVLYYYDHLEKRAQEEATAENSKLKAEAKNKQQDLKSAEQTCNDLEEKSDCDTNKKCTYDKTKEEGKRCTLRNEEKEKLEKENQETGGKDGKTTNTTGSSSFVIKASPLLLAFLLL